ncbi:MAG: low temperature requirement protein A [bacterium]|nr:low temperature requirement protein A [bacterium]
MSGHPPVFRAPQLHVGDGETNRRVTWMELFFDLVYVATLVQLGNYLSDNTSLQGFLAFAFLFIPVWWSWIGTTFYANRFDSDDTLHRVLVFAQIAAVYNMAVNLEGGLGENTARFALAYAFGRFILVLMYFRAANSIPQARALATRYGLGFLIAGIIWATSAFVPAPARYIVWVIALAVDFGTPLVNIRLQLMLPPSAGHLPERFGLFTIIVLGEGFLKVVGGMSGVVLTIPEILLDVPGLVIAGALWWIYFDNVAETRFRINRFRAQVWLYTHLPLHLSLTALGVGIYKLVTQEDAEGLPENYRWLICGSVALAFLTIGIIEWTISREWNRQVQSELVLRVIGAAVALLLAIFGGLLAPTVVMWLLGLNGVLQVAVDLLWRYQRQQAGEHVEPAKTLVASGQD